jgi:hypothetical protein
MRIIIRKTAPGLKNSLSLLKMSVRLGAAFTSIKAYKNITSIICLRHDKNIRKLSLSQSTDQYDVGNADLEIMLYISKVNCVFYVLLKVRFTSFRGICTLESVIY